jgi:8-oxo-dGTP pyrophosphatase MutT (NUDIX family)
VSAAGPKQVRAAGGVVWRRARSGRVELVLVHRPRYDDWSLPKGKAHRGESDRDTALREVEEETGLRCRLGPELTTVRYRTDRGEAKTVRWWAMTVRKDVGFVPDDEVDEMRWVTLKGFERLGSFDSDREVVHSFVTCGAADTAP